MTTINPVIHFEMQGKDGKRMSDFYTKAFGWKTMELGPEMNHYIVVATTDHPMEQRPTEPGTIDGGFYVKTADMPEQPPSLVIAVPDIVKHVEIVKNAGGTITNEPMEIPGVGIYASFIDTEGNRVSMLQPSEMP